MLHLFWVLCPVKNHWRRYFFLESSTVLPAWLLSMWFMSTIHPPLKSYRQNTKQALRTEQILQGNENINLIIHNSQVPKSNKVRSNQYVESSLENQVTPQYEGGHGIEVTTFRYPRVPSTFSWTKSEVQTYLPSKFTNSLKTSEINAINNNLVNTNINEIPEPFVRIKSTTTAENLIDKDNKKQVDSYNNFNNILINSKLFKHLKAITSYAPPPAKNMSPKDLNNIMTNSPSHPEMKNPMKDTTLDDFRNLESFSHEIMPNTQDIFGSMNSMPSKPSSMNDFSNSIKPTSNLYDMSTFGNKITSKEQTSHSAENIMSPGVESYFGSNLNSMNKPLSTAEIGNNVYFNMDTMPKSVLDSSSETKTNLNGLINNGLFSNENVYSMSNGMLSNNGMFSNEQNQGMGTGMDSNGGIFTQEQVKSMENGMKNNDEMFSNEQSMGNGMYINGMYSNEQTIANGVNSNGMFSNEQPTRNGMNGNNAVSSHEQAQTMGNGNGEMFSNEQVKLLENGMNSNGMFSHENVQPLGNSESKNTMDMSHFTMSNPETKFYTQEEPNRYNSYADQFNTYLKNVNSINNMNKNPVINNPMNNPNNVGNLNNVGSNFTMTSPALETYPYELHINPSSQSTPPTTMSKLNPDDIRMNPNFVNWENELFNSNLTNNFANIDLKKLKPQGMREKENRASSPTTPAPSPSYRSMSATGMNQPGKEQKNKSPMKSSTVRPSTEETKSISPEVPSTFPSSSHFQVAFRWKIMDFVFRNMKQKANLIKSNKFIPENNLPLGIGIWRNRIFLSFPKWRTGIPVTLASFDMNDPSESPLMTPYPNWSYFDDSNCNSLISVFRMSIDKCDRLWVMDTGVTNIISSIQQLCPPKLMVFDLKSNTLIRKYTLPTAQVFEGSLFSNIATELVEDCDHAFAYVNDVFRYGLIVYDFFKNTSYRLTHPYMYPEPLQSTYILDSLKFRWVDGIFGMAISPELSGKYKRHPYEYYHYNVHHYNGTNVDKTIRDDQRYMYFHSMSSNRHYYISTTDLRNSSRYVNSSDIDEYFHYLGQRHKNTQASASFINSNGVMFYNLVTKHSVGCWNTRSKVYLPQTQDIVQTSREILNFPNDLKIDTNDNIWVLSNKLHQYLYGFLDFKVYNYRILIANSNDLVRNTKCDPYLSLNDYIHNLQSSFKQCSNFDL